MNLKTFIILFLLGTLISCSSNRDNVKEKEPVQPVIPDFYRSN